MDKTCRYCFWWVPPELAGSKVFGVCELVSSEDSVAVNEESLAVAQDHEGYQAWLKTKENFGCVQWKDRDNEEN